MTRGLFVTATGTACGKTWLTRGLARALSSQGLRVAALKPLETGVSPLAEDATALARAARQGSGDAAGFVRLPAPLSPLAAARHAGQRLPSVAELAQSVQLAAREADIALVEGAGGLLVPIDERATVAELARELGFPLALVGRDALGTLSHVLTAWESAERRQLTVRAVVLVAGPWSEGDGSVETNAAILAGRLPCPVFRLPSVEDDDDALAQAVSPLLPDLFPHLGGAPR